MRVRRVGLVVGGLVISALSLTPALEALSGGTASLSEGDRTVDTRPVPGEAPSKQTRDARTPLNQERVRDLASRSAAQLVSQYPTLRGLSMESVAPVYLEESSKPAGFMVTYILPATVPRIEMHLTRSSSVNGQSVPEQILSEITNLRALDAIVLLGSGEMIHLVPAPRMADVDEPSSATIVRTVDPAAHRNAGFEGDDE
jgi:hypothetical protein